MHERDDPYRCNNGYVNRVDGVVKSLIVALRDY